jgi:hypothetical protein
MYKSSTYVVPKDSISRPMAPLSAGGDDTTGLRHQGYIDFIPKLQNETLLETVLINSLWRCSQAGCFLV